MTSTEGIYMMQQEYMEPYQNSFQEFEIKKSFQKFENSKKMVAGKKNSDIFVMKQIMAPPGRENADGQQKLVHQLHFDVSAKNKNEEPETSKSNYRSSKEPSALKDANVDALREN